MHAENVEQATLMAALEELDGPLDELQELLEAEDGKSRLALQRLEEDGADLVRLDEMLSEWRDEVDIFDVLGLDSSEEFHSTFLAWLLDPKGSHGLGDHFLQGFLAVSGAPRAIRAGDRPSTTIRREKHVALDGGRGRLDIRILNESARFVCAIENKIRAPESGNQLAWYRKVLGRDHPDHQVHRVFLTPRGVMPDDPEEREHWTTMSYTDVLRLVEGAIAAEGNAANEDVMAFLRQYAITLRRNIVPEVSNDVHELARRIYRKHKRAIDLIIEHQERYEPNYVTEGFRMIRDAIGRQAIWKESTTNHPYVRFVSAEWEKYEEELSLAGWPYTLLQFQVQVTDRRATLTLFWAPGENEALRRKMFDRVRDYLDTVHSAQPTYTEGYVRLHTVGKILEESDYENWWDEESTGDTIRDRLDGFAQGEFPEINRIILECLEEYRSEGR
jgi:hypothetical protein